MNINGTKTIILEVNKKSKKLTAVVGMIQRGVMSGLGWWTGGNWKKSNMSQSRCLSAYMFIIARFLNIFRTRFRGDLDVELNTDLKLVNEGKLGLVKGNSHSKSPCLQQESRQ